MIELGVGADLFRMAGGIFWLVVIGIFVAALLIPKTRKSKAIAIAVVTVLFAAFPGRWFWEMKSEADAQKARLAKAEAMFQERCKTAGEFIHKTAENVDGILLLKVRPSEMNFGDQFKMDDPYGFDVSGDGYIENFLRDKDERGSLVNSGVRRGYRYVDVVDPADGKRYRYTGSIKVVGRKDPNTPNHQVELARNPSFDLNNYAFMLDRVPAPAAAPRYGVTYDDISTHEDRQYWIAGSSLKVIDLKTNEVMAERIGYMMDRGQGALGQGGSHPAWGRARRHACPAFPQTPDGRPFAGYQSRNFVEKAIKPIQEK
jgi:hypothetical protein